MVERRQAGTGPAGSQERVPAGAARPSPPADPSPGDTGRAPNGERAGPIDRRTLRAAQLPRLVAHGRCSRELSLDRVALRGADRLLPGRDSVGAERGDATG